MLARHIVLALLVAAAKASCAVETPPQLKSGRHAASPDGKFYVFYRESRLEIRDMVTSTARYRIEQKEPVMALLWTGDSKTLIVVHRIPIGSYAYFWHWDGTKWRPESIEIPFERLVYERLAVIDVRPHRSTIDVTYKTYLPTRIISFRFIPAKGDASHIRRHGITVERWRQLRMFPSGSTNASNHAMERTAARCASTLSMTNPLPLRATFALGGGRSSYSR